MKIERPVAVTILAVLAAIAAVLAVIDVFRYLGSLVLQSLGPMHFYGLNILGAGLAAFAAAIWLWAAWKLWKVDELGWVLVVAIALLYLFLDIIAVIAGTSLQAVLPSLIASVVVLILALLPGTREVFGQP